MSFLRAAWGLVAGTGRFAARRPGTTLVGGLAADLGLNDGRITMAGLRGAFSRVADATGLGTVGLAAVATIAGAGLLAGGGMTALTIAAGAGALAWAANNTEVGQQVVQSIEQALPESIRNGLGMSLA